VDPSILHYRILEKLGQGGMGVVYKAFDTILQRTVALKFLPEQLASDDATRRHLLVEAQAASRLDHPNICPIHTVEETPDGRLFICMAWCDGESLNRRIEAGPLELDEALHIVVQVGEGLEAAHEHGIIHRDIKPSNIMLSAKGLPRITDFGLARIGQATRSTRSRTAGTIQYMSPEQVRGDGVDYRADVWSLGVVLYELVTGRRPFEGEYDASAMYSILNEAFTPPSRLRESLPPEIDRVIARALEKDVSKRYASVREMLNDLEGIRRALDKRSSPTAALHASQGRLRRLTRREWVVSITATALLFGALAVITNRVSRVHPRPITVAVLEFENERGDSTYAGLLEDLLETGLGQSPYIMTVDKGRMMELKRSLGVGTIDLASAFALARGAEVTSLISPSALSDGDILRVSARVYDVAMEKMVFSEYVQGKADETGLIDLMDELCGKLKKRLRVAPRWGRVDHERKLADLTTSSMPAYRLFSRGESIYLGGNPMEGIPLIEQAVALDSNFCAAYRRLALWYDYIEDYGRALFCARKLKEYSRGDELAFMKSAIVEYRVRGEYAQAITLMKSCLEMQPADVGMHLDLGYVLYRNEKRYDEAVFHLNKVLELDPTNLKGLRAKAYASLGNAYLYAGKFDEALGAFEQFGRMNPDGPDAPHSIAMVRRCRGDYAEAIEGYQDVIRRYPEFWVSYDELGMTYLAVGKWRKALQSFASYIERSPRSKRPNGYALRGTLYLAQGSLELADREADSMLAIDSLSLRAHWLRGRIALAGGGGLERARRELGACEDILNRGVAPSSLEYYHSLKGWVWLSERRLDGALAELALADRLALPSMRSFRIDYIEGCITAGRTDDAIRMGLDLHAYNENDAEVSYLLGRAYERAGDREQAARFFGMARSVWAEADPDFRPLRSLASKNI
jgi:tetratricopeptide (TPR) repeat protein